MLAACGGAPEEAGLAPVQEPLGTQRQALCSGTSVSSLTISGVSSWGGELAGSGNWVMSGGANAVRLEYRVDGSLRTSEERTGASGTWYFSTQGITCGSHTFQVKAFPMVIDSVGNRTTCWDGPTSVSQAVTQACPTASLSCSQSSSTVTCTGSGSGGSGGPYTYTWMEVHQPTETPPWSSGWYPGGSSNNFYCVPSYVFFPADFVHFEVKVRDSSGMESPVTFGEQYLCEP
jgi:hypothetical protein